MARGKERLSKSNIYDAGAKRLHRPRTRTRADGTVIEERLPAQAFEMWVSPIGNVGAIVTSNGPRNRRTADPGYRDLIKWEHRKAGAIPYFVCPHKDEESTLPITAFPEHLRQPCKKGTYGPRVGPYGKCCPCVQHIVDVRRADHKARMEREASRKKTPDQKRLELERERLAKQDQMLEQIMADRKAPQRKRQPAAE